MVDCDKSVGKRSHFCVSFAVAVGPSWRSLESRACLSVNQVGLVVK